MVRIISLLLICALLTGVANAADTPAAPQFAILGASVDLHVTRGGTTLPATFVPYLQRGDVISIAFPKGVQFSKSPRWHLIVADMYDDYLQHQPDFPIPDADLSRAKAGHVWKVSVKEDATPIIFLVPENGNRYGHGIPQARSAITTLANRALLLRTATLSANAQAKESTLGEFLHSLASITPSAVDDGRAHVIAATQSLFGYDLGSAACFQSNVPQSTQYACAARAVASSYDNVPKANVVATFGSQLPVTAATYGMLVGALYGLLAKRRVEANYIFDPGAIKPGDRSTNVFVEQQPAYDAGAAQPSTIVYFEIGSRATSPTLPAFDSPPATPLCPQSNAFDVAVSFTGLPVYFRAHRAIVHAAGKTFAMPAEYDPVTGFHVTASASQFAALHAGGSLRIQSDWGFDTIESAPVRIVEPRAASWTLQNPSDLIMGQRTGTLTFTDAGAGMGACVRSVSIKDATGAALPVEIAERTTDSVTVHVDAANALGPTAIAVVSEGDGITSAPQTAALLPPMPQVTHAVAYLPKGTLVLQGTGLKYINTVSLERTGIVFANGTPNPDGSWTFVAQSTAPYQAAWEHETMAISYSLQPPDSRTAAVQADVEKSP